jgi:hypothetical protein
LWEHQLVLMKAYWKEASRERKLVILKAQRKEMR